MEKNIVIFALETDNKKVLQRRTLRNEIFGILHSLRKYVAVLSICALTLVIILLITTIILLIQRNQIPVNINLMTQNKKPEIQNTAVNSTEDELKIVSRLEWLALPPVKPPNPLPEPVPYVIIHHTATENCSFPAQCIFHVRFIQNFHIENRNWWDIGYNFLVGGDGEAYEGRGWKGEGAHSFGYNKKSIGIAFIGTFNSIKPPERQIIACKKLISKGVEEGFIRRDYKLLAARQLQTTQSPGAALYEEIKTWDHWAKNP